MKSFYKKLRIVIGFALFFIVSESKALTISIKNSINGDTRTDLDKRITDVRKKVREHLKEEGTSGRIVDFRNYTHENDWVNWVNWGNWNNWNNWYNWDKWTNWSNQWSNFVNS